MVVGRGHVLRTIGIRDIHKASMKREISATKLCNESLDRVKSINNLNPFITLCEDEARTRAKQLDDGADKHILGQKLLYGVPISIKDNFCTKQVLTTCGSKMLSNFVPPYNATVVTKLQEANSIMIGKTNMDEFAMGSSCTTSFYGPTANHWKSEQIDLQGSPMQTKPSNWFMAGGSSTGSAVSVASGACFASIGTDTGGSTRQPASLTGVVGFKPTYGLISRFGLVPLVHTLDVVSILTRRVDDARIVFDTIVGQDENDLTSVDHKESLTESPNLQAPNSQLTIRVGVPRSFIDKSDSLTSDISDQLDRVLGSLNSCGNVKFEVKNLELEHANYATECYTVISSAEIASNMSCYDGVKYGLSVDSSQISGGDESRSEPFDRDLFYKTNRDQGFGSEVKKRILLGNYFLLSGNRDKYLTQALKLRRLISDEFDKAFDEGQIDVILMPSTPTTSVSYEDWLQKQDTNKLFREDYFLIPANLANLPSISVPSGLSSSGLPIGLQLISKRFHDLDLLRIAEIFEEGISQNP